MTLRATVAAGTDIGHVREGNEDSFTSMDPLFAVADGMGGHAGGEVASGLALETIERLFTRGEGDLAEQVHEANRIVFERSVLDRSVAGMGTTLTAALLEGDRVRLAHVGDSRAYLLRDGELRQLTEDHTLVRRMVLEGELTEAEAEVHPHRNILTRVLGVGPDIEIDELWLDPRSGDRLLLCSDGLTGMVPDDRVGEILRADRDPQRAVDRLIREANEAGGVDNITAIVIDLVDADERDPAEEDVIAGEEPITTIADGGEGSGPPPTTVVEREPREAPAGHDGPLRTPPPPAPASGGLSWPKAAAWVGGTLGVLLLLFVGLRLYLDTQWFVGVSDGRVAIYRGIPAQVAGLDLHQVVVETSIPADTATALPLYRDLEEGITAEDRVEAESIVEQIRRDATVPGAAGP